MFVNHSVKVTLPVELSPDHCPLSSREKRESRLPINSWAWLNTNNIYRSSVQLFVTTKQLLEFSKSVMFIDCVLLCLVAACSTSHHCGWNLLWYLPLSSVTCFWHILTRFESLLIINFCSLRIKNNSSPLDPRELNQMRSCCSFTARKTSILSELYVWHFGEKLFQFLRFIA